MAGIGVLVDDGTDSGYAYKILVPSGTKNGAVVDLSNPSGGPVATFMDNFYKASANAEGKPVTLDGNGNPTRVDIIENGEVTYFTSFYYNNSGQLIYKVVSKTNGDSVLYQVIYDINGNYTNIILVSGAILVGSDPVLVLDQLIEVI